MNVMLFSTDRHTCSRFREILGSLPGNKWQLFTGEPGHQPLPESDFYVWDVRPGLCLPQQLERGDQPRHLFLVNRKELASFRTQNPLPDVSILLKPVTRATLESFFGQAAREQDQSSLDALRIERDEMLQCLIQANLKLQEYDHDRTNFLARALHDFRAPLTAVGGYCGLLLDGQLGPLNEEQREVVQRMQHSSRRLSTMATAMFQLSVGRHVEVAPNLQRGDLQECLDQALHEIGLLLEEKHIEVSLQLRPSPEPLFFEAPSIEQVFLNLLANASRFTPKFGSIEIEGYPFFWERRLVALSVNGHALNRRLLDVRAPNAYRVDIRDSGPGIPPEDLDRIFEEYTSYSGGQDRSGGGLGLAICRMILNRHQGQIWAETNSAGAIFSFVLPFRRREVSADETIY
jgi:signal transduction histidine kinase